MLLLLRQLPFVISRIVILMEKNTIEDDWLSPFFHGDQLLWNVNIRKWKHCYLNCPLSLCSFWCIVCRLWHRLIQNSIVNKAFCWSKISFFTNKTCLSKSFSTVLPFTYKMCGLICAKNSVIQSLHSYYHYITFVMREHNERWKTLFKP